MQFITIDYFKLVLTVIIILCILRLFLKSSMHDYSRDIMLATAQEQTETRLLLNAAERKGKEMENR